MWCACVDDGEKSGNIFPATVCVCVRVGWDGGGLRGGCGNPNPKTSRGFNQEH